jgi:putative spermidine/putrescine transport system ATP-binding protein
MSDRVVLLNHGRIEQIGTPEELYDTPATRFAAEFIGETNLIEGVVAGVDGTHISVEAAVGGRYDALARDGRLQAGDGVYLMVRPERIDVGTDRTAGAPGLPATVTKRVFAGDLLTFGLRTEQGLELRCTKPSLPRYRDLVPGTKVWAVVQDCRALPREQVPGPPPPPRPQAEGRPIGGGGGRGGVGGR